MSRQLSRRLYLGQKERPQRGDMSKKARCSFLPPVHLGKNRGDPHCDERRRPFVI
jgi:hypothetical protein